MEQENDRETIRASLATMSFEDLQKLKEEMGEKLYNETVLNFKKKPPKTNFKRTNKNRPREMPSKRPVKSLKEIIPVKKTVLRDPRFDPLCGSYEANSFKKNYKFIDKIKIKERDMLAKELENTEDEKRHNQIKYLITRMDNQLREKTKKDKQKEIEITKNVLKKETIKRGEKPEYQNKSEKRIMDLLNQYEELKQSKRLKKHIEKKSRKMAIKEKIKLKQSSM